MNHFETIHKEMMEHGMKTPSNKVFIKLDNAESILKNALTYFLAQEGKNLLWLPEYDEVVNWLTDNKGRGLFLYGNCGRGKSLLTRYVLPAILLNYFRKVVSVYDVQEMNAQLDTAMQKHILSLDDIGTEEMINIYGNKRMAFAEIMDAVEKQSKLIIISTNLQEKDISGRYGDRILDRVRAATTRILFKGKSLRQ